MASAERSVGVRNGGAALWFSSLASLDFTMHLFSAAEAFLLPKPGGSVALPTFRPGPGSRPEPCTGVMIRITYIMEYLAIWPYCRGLRRNRRTIGATPRPGAACRTTGRNGRAGILVGRNRFIAP